MSQETLNSVMEQTPGFQIESDGVTWGDEESGYVMVSIDFLAGGYVVNCFDDKKKNRRFDNATDAANYATSLAANYA